MPSVLVIGDSFVQGVGAPEGFGWAQRVAKAFPAADFDIRGVGSDTAEKVYARWPQRAYDVVVVQVGTNDACHRGYKGEAESSPERFAKYLARLHERAGAARLVLVGLLYVDESRTAPFGPDKSYDNASIQAYDAVIRRYAKRFAIDHVSLHDLPRHGKMLFDGLHPSDRGHDYIAHRVIKALKPILDESGAPLGGGADHGLA